MTSRANTAFRRLRRLAASPRERRKEGQCLLEGKRLVEAFLATEGSPVTLVLTPGGLRQEDIRAIVDRVPEAPLLLLDAPLFRELSGLTTPSSIMAVVEIPVAEEPSSEGDMLLLDGIQDPGNLGMALRSAAAAGLRRVLLSPSCADPWSPKVLRSGMGAHFHLDVAAGANLPLAARRYRGSVLVLDHRGADSLYEVELTGAVAFAVGSEGGGVSPALRKEADRCLFIPMPGWREPLNAAAAVTVCLFEMIRQRGGG